MANCRLQIGEDSRHGIRRCGNAGGDREIEGSRRVSVTLGAKPEAERRETIAPTSSKRDRDA
jgi:hypothetical protein